MVHNCLILDHSDTHQRLGFVTDIQHEHLDLGKVRVTPEKKQTERLPKACPNCAYLKPVGWGLQPCPNCGFETKIVSRVPVADGELVELRPRRGDEWSLQAKTTFYGELRWIEQERGYKQGWAAHQYRKRLGVWPHHLVAEARPIMPGRLTTNWVRGMQIRYAKSKQKLNQQLRQSVEAERLLIAASPQAQ